MGFTTFHSPNSRQMGLSLGCGLVFRQRSDCGSVSLGGKMPPLSAQAHGAFAMAFNSFQDFYPYYLAEHANRTSRRLHVIGTCGALSQLVLVIVLLEPVLALSAVLTGYGFAWVGHFIFEKNKPATFRYPLYSLRGDFTMAVEVLRGRIRW